MYKHARTNGNGTFHSGVIDLVLNLKQLLGVNIPVDQVNDRRRSGQDLFIE